MEACVSHTPSTFTAGMFFMLLLGLYPGSALGEVDLWVFVYIITSSDLVKLFLCILVKLCTVYERAGLENSISVHSLYP